MLSKEEEKQYSRHLILDEIGNAGQLKLKQAKVLMVGAGGLGCPILQYLTAAGVGTIGIIDLDCVDQSNLQRQILYTYNDIGKYKAKVAATRLSQLNPFITFKTYVEPLTKENAINIFKNFDVIVDGSDNFPTRYLVNDAAVLTNKPLVFGSIFKFEGQVSVFNYKNGPTYRCLFPTPPKSASVPNCSEIGVLGVLPGIIGVLQANEVLKIICEMGTVLSGKLLAFNALSLQQSLFNFEKNPAVNITSLEKNYKTFCRVLNSINEITYSDYKKHPENYNLLDVRNLLERKHHNIGGIHIPLNELLNKLDEIPLNKPLIVYCKSGIRSKKAIEILTNNAIKIDLINLKDGLINSSF
ncbi:molybdopterin-synthase adenylyltransferase MoeB [Mariniflexile sp. HNIBRBA6329]|uniref:molybdopterin-synthase adenylyltransferase MoeB n=1 Tax=Mariniflexile sp. HNIBRBA6329 TaxID=3373088 RepID=UPI003744EB74